MVARTGKLQTLVVEIPQGLEIHKVIAFDPLAGIGGRAGSEGDRPERVFYQQFWREFVAKLVLDDPGQPMPDIANSTNLFVYPSTKNAWISAFFSNSSNRVGVYFRCSKNQIGQEIRAALEPQRDSILAELGRDVAWDMEREDGGVLVQMPCDDVFAVDNRETISRFLADWINRLVNAFRPRVKRITTEILGPDA